MQGHASMTLEFYALGMKHLGEFPKKMILSARDFVCPLSGAHRDAATEPARQRKSLEGRPPA